ncbi:MAG: glycosyltransferase family 2 protein, partial [Marmoricola sp.]
CAVQVSVLLVSHNGARWLPAVVAGVEQQTRRLDHLVAVDTGSRDESVIILRRNGRWDVAQFASFSSYAESVEAGLAKIPAAPDGDPEWIWLLHDDSAPDPQALERLLTAAEEHPDVPIFGPKLREWPSLRRLLEVGVTISGSGRRETGLERGEYDQGQHDERRVVLAVNTAGMLVRRDVLTDLGFDPHLPVYGNDIDFGWRAARAGHATMVVPDALMFHAEAAHRGQRRSGTTTSAHRQARTASIYTLMANGSAAVLPFRAVRLVVVGVLRMLGKLLVRAPLDAWAELVAVVSVLGRPRRLRAARRRRQQLVTVPASEVRHLLAPPWLPLRHGMDFVADFGSAAVDLGRESVAGRTVRSAHSVSVDDDASSQERGLVALLLRNPRFWLVVAGVTLALVAGRGLLTGGPLHGGALLAAPNGVGHWWSSYLAGNHRLGTGSPATAPAYLLPLGVLGVLAFGHAGLVVSVLFLLAVPLTALSALRFFHRTVHGRVAPIWGAVSYALLPVVSGAVGHGRLGTVAGALILPWVATSALGLRFSSRDLRWRAVWRTALGAALLTAFVPTAWILVALLALVLLVTGLLRDRPHWRKVEYWGVPVAIVVSVPILLLPWVFGVIGHPGAWLPEAGRTGLLPSLPPTLDLALGRPGPGGAPLWLGAGTVLPGLLAGFRADTRSRVVTAWVVAAAGALVLALVSRVVVHLPGIDGGIRVWSGFPLLVVQGALVAAAVIAGDGLWGRTTSAHFGWRQPVAFLGILAATVGVVGGTLWWVVGGVGGPLHRGPVTGVPEYMSALSDIDAADGVLVLRGDRSTGVTYDVLRNGPLRLGDDAIAALTPPDAQLTTLVGRLLADPQAADARSLSSYGIAYVFAPRPAGSAVTGSLDAASGFSRASAPTPQDAAWRLQERPTLSAVSTGAQYARTVLLVAQLLLIACGIVLALPTRRTTS